MRSSTRSNQRDVDANNENLNDEERMKGNEAV